MSTLMEQLATDRVAGRMFVLAYAIGLVGGIALAVAALAAIVG